LQQKGKHLFKCSVGVIAYNEEKNIGCLLNSLLMAKTDNFVLHELYVISDGSVDRTNEIVKEFSERDRRIKLIAQDKREGKARAVNRFLKNAKGDICILSSADIGITDVTIQNLCTPLIMENKVGMTGCNPIPLIKSENFLGYIIHFWWFAHNRLPRFGEMVAFKNILNEIDGTTAVDEAFIEKQISQKGLQLKHVSTAVIYNLGAETLNDLLKQRKRINIGHIYLNKIQGYRVNSFNIIKIFSLAIKYWKRSSTLKHLIWLIGGALLETYCRISARMSIYFLKENPFIWEIACTTKGKIKSFSHDSI